MRHVILHRATSLEAALALKAASRGDVRILAGGTDLVIGLRAQSAPDTGTHDDAREPLELVDISGIAGLGGIDEAGDTIAIGCLATHAQVERHPAIRAHAPLLAAACAEIGSPPIRNRGTLAGNLCNASPCADTLPPLMALDARVTLRSMRGERTLSVAEAVLAPYRTALEPEEILTQISFDRPPPGTRSVFTKLGRRNALSVSRMSIALIGHLDEEGRWRDVRVAAGSVAPAPCRFPVIESMLEGESPDDALAAEAGRRLAAEMVALCGRRWSTPYKEPVAAALLERALGALRDADGAPHVAPRDADATVHGEAPRSTGALPARQLGQLGQVAEADQVSIDSDASDHIEIQLVLNGRPVMARVPARTTLLQLVRDTFLLTGTKCGCEIGECGACTVILDGDAVNSCLVLAGQVHGRHVETVEGLADRVPPTPDALHPLQRAFLDHDAVACGFCTPGMLMSAKALLDATPRPSRRQIRTALSGNLCRCTGYVSIVEAVEQAARELAGAASAHGTTAEERLDVDT